MSVASAKAITRWTMDNFVSSFTVKLQVIPPSSKVDAKIRKLYEKITASHRNIQE